jgi:hypothetical protein
MDASLHVDYFAEHRLAVCRPVASLTEEAIEQLLDFILGLEARTPESFNRLLDLALVNDFPLQSAVIYRYAALRREAIAGLPPCRTAIIAPNPQAETVAKIYESLMHGSNIVVGVFKDAETAANWLGAPLHIVGAPGPSIAAESSPASRRRPSATRHIS